MELGFCTTPPAQTHAESKCPIPPRYLSRFSEISASSLPVTNEHGPISRTFSSHQRADGVDPPPEDHSITNEAQVGGDDQKKHNPKGKFQGLVAKDLSAQLCTGPAPQDSHDMKRPFRNPGLLSNGSALVDSIGNESDDAPCNRRQKIDCQCGRKSNSVPCKGEIKQIRSRSEPEDRKKCEPPLKAVKRIQPFQPGTTARHDALSLQMRVLEATGDSIPCR